MKQIPGCGEYELRWKGESLAVSLTLDSPRQGRAVFRTDVGGEWTDLLMSETSPGTFAVTVPLEIVGVFDGTCCFFPDGASVPESVQDCLSQWTVASSELLVPTVRIVLGAEDCG